jgi:hypothetical protein
LHVLLFGEQDCEAKFRPKGPNEVGEFALGHDHLYPGVAEDRAQVRLGQAEVHGRRDDAELGAGDEELDDLEPVVKQVADAVPGPDAGHVGQVVSQPVRAGLQVGVGQRPPAILLYREARGMTPGVVADRDPDVHAENLPSISRLTHPVRLLMQLGMPSQY